MLLVIPSITIRDGKCVGSIVFPAMSSSEPTFEAPKERARLLRKENAKAIHLIFEGEMPVWADENLSIIKEIKDAVDIPVEVSLSTIPENLQPIKALINAGVYRIFLPLKTDTNFVSNCILDFTRQKIVATTILADFSSAVIEQ